MQEGISEIVGPDFRVLKQTPWDFGRHFLFHFGVSFFVDFLFAFLFVFWGVCVDIGMFMYIWGWGENEGETREGLREKGRESHLCSSKIDS